MPGSVGSFDKYATQYRIDPSRVTLREFRNISGRPLLGTFFWIAMRAGLKILGQQIVDGPKAFAEEQCASDQLGDKVRELLLAKAQNAETLGFHSSTYSAVRSSTAHASAIEVQGGAVRMLHESQELFLQILASAAGNHTQSYELIVSATYDLTEVYVASSGPPGFNVPPGMIGQRLVGAPLDKLLKLHQDSIAKSNAKLIGVDSIEAMGRVLDHMAHLFFDEKIDRGIYVPVT